MKKTFALRRYYKFAQAGVFYIYVSRLVIAGIYKGGSTPGLQKYVISPILKLTLRAGKHLVWQVVPAVPRPKPKPRPSLVDAPPFPKYKIPRTGPIATLVEIVKAVRIGNLQVVRQLCYHGGHGPEPFYVALADEAMATARCCRAIQKRFRVNPWPQITPSPDVFAHILAQLNPQSLKISGNKASVGVLWFHDGKFVPFPSFAYHFRKVLGRWLLDSWATQSSAPRAGAESYRLNVENSLKEARVFDGLTRDLAAGKFTDLHAFIVFARRRMQAVDDWFMLQSMKHNKQWMKANASWVKRVKADEKASQTQP